MRYGGFQRRIEHTCKVCHTQDDSVEDAQQILRSIPEFIFMNDFILGNSKDLQVSLEQQVDER